MHKLYIHEVVRILPLWRSRDRGRERATTQQMQNGARQLALKELSTENEPAHYFTYDNNSNKKVIQ